MVRRTCLFQAWSEKPGNGYACDWISHTDTYQYALKLYPRVHPRVTQWLQSFPWIWTSIFNYFENEKYISILFRKLRYCRVILFQHHRITLIDSVGIMVLKIKEIKYVRWQNMVEHLFLCHVWQLLHDPIWLLSL